MHVPTASTGVAPGPSIRPFKIKPETFMTSIWKRLSLGICAAALALGPASAQEAKAPALSLELNALQPSERGCRFTFVVANQLQSDITRAAFELVLFDKNGLVERLTVVDFMDLPQGKTKVRQFDFNGTKCEDVGRVLVNNATECTGEGVDASTCIRELETKSLGDVTFGS